MLDAGISKTEFSPEQLVAEPGVGAVRIVVGEIIDAVRQSDDEAVGRLDRTLRLVENHLAEGKSARF